MEKPEIVKPQEPEVDKWVPPEGKKPQVFAKQIGNTGLIHLNFSRKLLLRDYPPSDEDLKFFFIPYDGTILEFTS